MASQRPAWSWGSDDQETALAKTPNLLASIGWEQAFGGATGRGVKVGLGLGVVCVLALNLHNFRPLRLSRKLSRLMGVAVLALILVVTVSGLEIGEVGYLSRFQDISLGSSEGSVYWRLTWWQRLLEELFARNPLFGLGFGESLGVYNPYLIDNEYSAWPVRAPHNINLSVLARMGLVGLAIYFRTSAWDHFSPFKHLP